MSKFEVYFETTISQRIEVEAEDDQEAADLAYEEVSSVPFIGWNFDASGDWEISTVHNKETDEYTDY